MFPPGAVVTLLVTLKGMLERGHLPFLLRRVMAKIISRYERMKKLCIFRSSEETQVISVTTCFIPYSSIVCVTSEHIATA